MMEINVQLLAQLYVDLLTWFVQEELIIMDVKCLILVDLAKCRFQNKASLMKMSIVNFIWLIDSHES